MDEETMVAIDDLEAFDAAEDEDDFGDAAGTGNPSNHPTQCS